MSALLIFIPLIALTLILYINLFYLRRKNADLLQRNKRLAALRKLDEVMMSSTTSLSEVAQKVTDAIAFELGFEVGVLALIDEKSNMLKRVAMSNTITGIQAKKHLPVPYEQLEISLAYENNLSVKAAKNGKMYITHDLYDVFVPAFDRELSKKIQETVNIKTSFIYPVKVKGKTIGVIIVSVSRSENQVSLYEKETIEDLVDVVGIALDNAILYKSLTETTEKLKQANVKLRELDQIKDDFVSVASHELRTPMTAIKSYAWMALNRPDMTLSEKMKKYLVRVLMSTDRLINLVNDMLNISRIESGRIEILPEPVDLVLLSRDIIDEVYYSKSIEKPVNFHLLEQKLPKVFADPNKLRQVFLNIVGNALKFSPPEGEITIGFFTDGQMVEIFIKDQGPGISKEDISRLFKKFSRLDNSYTAAATSGGTGLGLYISKNLIELMHGKIWVESEGLGKGATFKFSLPIASEENLVHADQFRVKPQGDVKELEPVVL